MQTVSGLLYSFQNPAEGILSHSALHTCHLPTSSYARIRLAQGADSHVWGGHCG